MPQLNETAETCHDCKTELEPGQATRASQWDNWRCADCEVKKEEKDARRKAGYVLQGEVLLDILPAIRKLGYVYQVRSGQDEWRSAAHVKTASGKRFVITVELVDEE